MSTSRQDELVYIVSPDASEQEVTDLHAQVEAVMPRIGGELVKSENWGRRKMAYEFGPHKEGVDASSDQRLRRADEGTRAPPPRQ